MRFLLVLAVAACATQRQMPGHPSAANQDAIDPVTVVLGRKTYFFAGAEAAPVVPESGSYRVAVGGEKTLRLARADGKGTVDLPAVPGTHEEKIEVPVAFTFQCDEDTEQVVLRLPGGKALHAIGSYSGSRPRGDVIIKTAPLAYDPLAGCKCVEIVAADFREDAQIIWTHVRDDEGWVEYWTGATTVSWMGAASRLQRLTASGSQVVPGLYSAWTNLRAGPTGLPLGAVIRAIDILWFDNDPYFDVVLTLQGGSTSVTTSVQVRSNGSSGYGMTRYVVGGEGVANQVDDAILTLTASIAAKYGSYQTVFRAVRLWYTE